MVSNSRLQKGNGTFHAEIYPQNLNKISKLQTLITNIHVIQVGFSQMRH